MMYSHVLWHHIRDGSAVLQMLWRLLEVLGQCCRSTWIDVVGGQGNCSDGVFGRSDLAALLRLPHLECLFVLMA